MALENVTVFLIHAPTRNLDDYAAIAGQACALKRFGEVHVNLSTLAGKSFHEIPAGGSPWHQYASNNPTPYKFFPHEMLRPFIPADFVRRNRDLLLRKADVLRKLGVHAAFWSYEPNFLPEAFYEAYPHMRGPRVDHPRRSRQEAFAPCLAVPETRQMIAWQVGELIRNVPEIKTFFFKTNDAGPGICWSDWQYSGPNGPALCRRQTMGQRVRDLLDAINKGAEMGGGEFRIQFTGNFSAGEFLDIERNLPDNAFCHQPRMGRGETRSIGGSVDSCYPCRGIVNPLALLHSLQGVADGKPRTVFVSFRPSYDRGYERPDATAKVFEMAADFLADPVMKLIPTLQRLQKWCKTWTSDEKQAEKLFDALVDLNRAMEHGSGGIRPATWAVSLRHATRPLVAVPGNLTDQEESYWLPHVFNVSVEEARQDYIDAHGGRPRNVNTGAAHGVIGQIRRVAGALEELGDCPEKELFGRMATSLRLYCCFMRSAANFYDAQTIRDRNKEKLSRISPPPPKEANWTGDADLTSFNEVMRSELDNAQEMIRLLADGGMEVVCHSPDPAEEDTFLLGPELVDQLKKKCKIMRRHWLDIQNHLMTPHK